MGTKSRYETHEVEHPGRPSPGILRAHRRFFDPIARLLHRPTLEGIEHLPERGPFLLVANHSAGMGMSEILCLAVMYLRLVGPERPLAGFAHPIAFRVFPVSGLLRSLGAVPSTYAAAKQTLAKGVPLLVFPGGDHETLRPLWQAHLVDFGGRVGFLRIAREANIPIVPLGIRGSHFTAPMLLRSRALAWFFVVPRLLGIKRWGISVLGPVGAFLIGLYLPASWAWRGALVWLWLGSAFVFLPWVPWTIRMRIGKPLPAGELFTGNGTVDGEEELRQALGRVQSSVQSLVDR